MCHDLTVSHDVVHQHDQRRQNQQREEGQTPEDSVDSEEDDFHLDHELLVVHLVLGQILLLSFVGVLFADLIILPGEFSFLLPVVFALLVGEEGVVEVLRPESEQLDELHLATQGDQTREQGPHVHQVARHHEQLEHVHVHVEVLHHETQKHALEDEVGDEERVRLSAERTQVFGKDRRVFGHRQVFRQCGLLRSVGRHLHW